MGKRITQQARGKGSLTFRVKKQAYKYKISYPSLKSEGKAKITKLFNSAAHSAPLIKVMINDERFFSPAVSGIYEGQEIEIRGAIANGNIAQLKNIPIGTKVSNIELAPGKGGKILRSAGASAMVSGNDVRGVEIAITNKKKKIFNGDCRATIGVVAGDGRTIKPLIKAGKQHHRMLALGRKWHRTSAVKVNVVDHPFGGGRGKRIKPKIAKRNSPPGKKVGHIRPRRTGKKK